MTEWQSGRKSGRNAYNRARLAHTARNSASAARVVKIRILCKILTCERENELNEFSILSIDTRGGPCASDYNKYLDLVQPLGRLALQSPHHLVFALRSHSNLVLCPKRDGWRGKHSPPNWDCRGPCATCRPEAESRSHCNAVLSPADGNRHACTTSLASPATPGQRCKPQRFQRWR